MNPVPTSPLVDDITTAPSEENMDFVGLVEEELSRELTLLGFWVFFAKLDET